MKVLVTGGAGYIGSHVTHQLVENGHEVTVVDNLYSGHRWAVPANANFLQADVGDREQMKAVLKGGRVEAILHFAAFLVVGESVSSPLKYYRNNVASSLELFQVARDAGVSKIIFSSSAAVYGHSKTGLVDEEAPCAPINPYGMTKLIGERMLRDLSAATGGEMRAVGLRYFNAAGARRDLRLGQATKNATHLVKVAAEAALGVREAVTIFGTNYPTPDGTCLRDYIHVEDLAQAHLDALTYLNEGGPTDFFNVGYGRLYSVREVLETMKKVSGRNFVTHEAGRREGDPQAIGADNTKIKQILGWCPQFDDLDLICRTSLDWERKFRSQNLETERAK